MKPELEDKLFEKYPEIFQDHKLDCRQTCMCWGIECGDGWYAILDALCAILQSESEYTGTQVIAEQVKQKWGTLRFYARGTSDVADGAIYMAEAMSARTCENCGATEGITTTVGWITMLCPACKMDRESKRKGA